tara:strand:- start:100 stop:297 length:198 start_codon:yes stop_codon:yes gene_type:complete
LVKQQRGLQHTKESIHFSMAQSRRRRKKKKRRLKAKKKNKKKRFTRVIIFVSRKSYTPFCVVVVG